MHYQVQEYEQDSMETNMKKGLFFVIKNRKLNNKIKLNKNVKIELLKNNYFVLHVT